MIIVDDEGARAFVEGKWVETCNARPCVKAHNWHSMWDCPVIYQRVKDDPDWLGKGKFTGKAKISLMNN